MGPYLGGGVARKWDGWRVWGCWGNGFAWREWGSGGEPQPYRLLITRYENTYALGRATNIITLMMLEDGAVAKFVHNLPLRYVEKSESNGDGREE